MVDTVDSKLIVGTLLFLSASCVFALPVSPLEESVCGSLREWLAFRMWSRAAGTPNVDAYRRMPNVEAISHVTTDNRTLRGFRIRAASTRKGSVLFAQGNAMLADQMLNPLNVLADSGFDVFVYDFRGYGQSNGNAHLKAIVSDYVELANAIAQAHPEKLYLYGVSFGGIVLLNALSSTSPVSATVVDSSPSRVSDLGCPPSYDPVARIPDNASSVMVIVGEQDQVIPPSKSLELAKMVEAHGGQVVTRAEFSHPFMDTDENTATSRLRLAIEFFNSK